jgi:hypothetical protein
MRSATSVCLRTVRPPQAQARVAALKNDSCCKESFQLVKSPSAMKKYLNLLSLLFATGLLAQDELPDLRVQNPGGTVQDIFEVKLLRVEPDGLRVLHAAGAAKVPYELLPQALQVKYGFNSAQAQEHRQSVAIQIAATRQHAMSSALAPAVPPAGTPNTLWAATPGSTHNPSTNWTAAADLVTNSNAFASNSNSTNYPSTPIRYETVPGNFTYRSPIVARVSSYRRSSRSTRYYGYTSNCHPYGSPTYYTSVPTIVTVCSAGSSYRGRSASAGFNRIASSRSIPTTAFRRPFCANQVSMR